MIKILFRVRFNHLSNLDTTYRIRLTMYRKLVQVNRYIKILTMNNNLSRLLQEKILKGLGEVSMLFFTF